MNIVEYIPYGKENAVSRTQLIKRTGSSDRAVREEIAQARRNHCILNDQVKGGYYRPTSEEIAAVERFILQESRRAKSIFYSLKAARDFVDGERQK